MAEIILAEQTIDGFLYMSSYEAYVESRDGETIPLKVGNTYTVIWDGTKYECVGQDTNDLEEGSVTVGNLASFDLSGNGEPFAVVGGTEGVVYMSFEEGESHTVAIYDGVLEEEGGGGEEVGKVIFEETAITFRKNSNDDIYCSISEQERPKIALEAGKTYTVVWDGVEYVCAAEAGEIYGYAAVFAGNKSIDPESFPDGTDTKEPFLIGYVSEISTDLVETLQTSETHTVAVYEGVLEEDSGEEVGKVILENRTVAYSADDGCWIAMNDEGTSPYLTDGLFSLTEGKTYTIVINGVEYVGEASKATVAGLGEVIGIGNGDALAGEEGNGEPYAAGFAQAGANASTFVFLWFDTDTRADTYTVSLYEGDITSGGGGGTEDGYLLKDAELAFELETNSETVYYNNEVAVALSVGKTYTVIWDGSYYDCVAKEYTTTDGENTLTFATLGNLSIQNSAEANTREPFVYLYVTLEGNRAANFKTLEKDASHVISIYDGVLEHPAVTHADIYTYDKDGNAVLHEKRSTVTFDTPDGRYAVFKLSHIADSRS